jgi:hypothetical protein
MNLDEQIAGEILNAARAALGRQAKFAISDNSMFTENDATYISKRLQLHHSITSQPLNKEAFEYLLVDVFARKGFEAEKTMRRDYPGEDVKIGNEKWSLKTETGKDTRPDRIHFTKFMECAWQKDYKSPTDYVEDAIQRILAHLSNYDRIITLRYIQASGIYEIVEVPKSLIQVVQYVEEGQLSVPTKRGGITMYLESTRNKGIRFRFDGSDDKLVLTGIPVARCIKHLTILSGNHFAGG